MERRRFKQTTSLDQRMLEHAARLRQEALGTASGHQRDQLLRLARQAETGAQMSGWLSSRGLQPPR